MPGADDRPARRGPAILQQLLLVALVGLVVGSLAAARREYVDWGGNRALEFSHDGKTLAVDAHWREAHRLALCDAETGLPRAMCDVGGRVERAAFSADDRWLAAAVARDAGEGSDMVVVDAATGEVAAWLSTAWGRVIDPTLYYSLLAFTPDGEGLVAAGPGPLRSWSSVEWDHTSTAQRALTEPRSVSGESITWLLLSPGGDLLAGRRPGESEIVLLDATGKTMGEIPVPVFPAELAFSPDGAFLAVRLPYTELDRWRVYHVATRTQLSERMLPRGTVRWSPESNLLVGLVATADDPPNRVLVAFDVRTGATTPPPIEVVVPGEADSLALAPGLARVAIGRSQSGVVMIDMATGAATPVFLADDRTRPASIFAFLATVWLVLWEIASRDWSATHRRGNGAGLGFHVGMGFALVVFGSSLGYHGYPRGAAVDLEAAYLRVWFLGIAALLVGLPLAHRQVRRSAGLRRILGWIGGAASLSVFPIGWLMLNFGLVSQR